MRRVVALATIAVALHAVSAFAQGATQAAPAEAAAPAAQPPAPFPQGAKYAYVNLQGIAQLSAEGKAASAKVQKLTQDKQKEGETKSKTLQSNQQKLQSGGNLLSDAARAQLEKDVERQTREGERFEQDAQAEITELTQELQADFNKKLFPILDDLAREKGLQMLFSANDAGLVWADPGLDLTGEAVKRLDALKPSAPAASAAKPAAAKPAAAKP